MNEIWKPIKGYEGSYEVSNLGRVKSLARYRLGKSGGIVPVKEKILTLKVLETGYVNVHLRTGKSSYPTVHRLVAETFIPNVDNKPTVNHKDSNKQNNTITNLEWATHQEQAVHAVEAGTMKVRGNTKYSPDFKREIYKYYLENSCSIRELSRKFGISQKSASSFAKGNTEPPVKIPEESIPQIIKLREEGKTLKSISELFGCGISQIHRITRGMSRNLTYER
jgi:NUMOD4 motif/HNH endonuclease